MDFCSGEAVGGHKIVIAIICFGLMESINQILNHFIFKMCPNVNGLDNSRVLKGKLIWLVQLHESNSFP